MAQYNHNSFHSPLVLKGLPKFMSLIFHQWLERAVWAFCELGIADLMNDYRKPITAAELSQLNGNQWNAEFLYRLLRVVSDADIVQEVHSSGESSTACDHPEESIRYRLTEDGILLTSDHFSRTKDMVLMDMGPMAANLSTYLPSLIKNGYKNGNSFEQAYGCNVFEYMQKDENKEYSTLFNNCLVAYSSSAVSSIVSTIDFGRFNQLVDVAGGLGTLLSSILEKYPSLHGILFDLAHVIENAKASVPNEFERRQVTPNRYEFVAGDMFKYETIPSSDAYVLKYIIHDWDDDKAIEILRSIRLANKNQAEKIITVFIVEGVILSNGKDNWEAHVMDLEMLSSVGSKERTLSEYINLINKSGYQVKHFHKTNGLMSIIEIITTTSSRD